ncbi:MAG: isoprenylcysteine carboxylmethyltransferase family protein [Bacteroidota bacterium]
MIALDLLFIVFLFSLFAYSHTWLASRELKERLAKKIGDKIAFYRIFYNFSSVLAFLAFLAIAPKPNTVIYDLQFPFDMITFALQVLSLIGLIWAFSQIDTKEFLGISQIIRYFNGAYSVETLDEKRELKLGGAFKYSRHPVYLFSILFLGLRPQMSLFYLTLFICLVIYFYAGSIYEERKLVEIFGDSYKEYQKRTPRIFPFRLKKLGM